MEDKSVEALDFYNSSQLYLNINLSRNETDFKNILDVISKYVPKKSKLLEFGCGTGNLAFLVAQLDYSVTGVDISDVFINHSKQVAGERNDLNVDFKRVDFGPLPFNNNSFDCIYTCAVLEHCHEIAEIVSDLHRLLKTGGILILATPNIISPFTRLLLIIKRITGKRKRYHLYGSPSFLAKSLWLNLKKGILGDKTLNYVVPDYDKFTESDEDVTFLSNPFDLLNLLRPKGYDVLEISRGQSTVGKLISKLTPKLSGEVLIVARKL